MQSGAVLFFPLVQPRGVVAKVSELDQFLLDFLQPFKPLAVSDLCLGSIAALTPRTPILIIQPFKVCDLVAKTLDLFAKHFNVIHAIRIPDPDRLSVGRVRY
jgi:hypothetical protein